MNERRYRLELDAGRYDGAVDGLQDALGRFAWGREHLGRAEAAGSDHGDDALARLNQVADRARAGLQALRTVLRSLISAAPLLGLLGTIHGMVSGFIGLSPDELQPGPLVHSLGTALRSSFVGFLIALVGVWTKTRPTGVEQPA